MGADVSDSFNFRTNWSSHWSFDARKNGKLILGFIPLRIFNAFGMASLLCSLYFVGGAQNPDSY